jgi:hypothetical protein
MSNAKVMNARTELFEVQVPARQLRCSCGHVIGAFDFQIDDPQELRAVCTRCGAELLRISWGVAIRSDSTGETDAESVLSDRA